MLRGLSTMHEIAQKGVFVAMVVLLVAQLRLSTASRAMHFCCIFLGRVGWQFSFLKVSRALQLTRLFHHRCLLVLDLIFNYELLSYNMFGAVLLSFDLLPILVTGLLVSFMS